MFIFIVVAGLTLYAIIRFRRRPVTMDAKPPQVYGSTQIELAWTVVPFLIVIVLFLTTTRYIFAIEGRSVTRDALQVTIVGNQWWWEIRYPGLGIVTANELHVPVSDPADPRPTFINAAVRRRDPQLLDPPARRLDGRHPGQDKSDVDRPEHARPTSGSAQNSAECSTPVCSSR